MTSPHVDEKAKEVVKGLRMAQARAHHRSFWAYIGRKVRGHLMAGILVVVPLGATVLILKWLFEWVDDILQPIIRTLVGQPVYGLGFAITLVVIYVAGVIVSYFGGHSLIRFAESLLARVPVVKQMYAGIKQILEGFASPRETGFMQVVLVEFPRKGIRTLGFITNEEFDSSGQKLLNVFIPTAPNPTSGFLEIMREEDVLRTDIPVDDALKMIVSAGRVSLNKVNVRLSNNGENGEAQQAARKSPSEPSS
ncbi:MAG: DUF502 domain-containing protein [Chloroflexi bacterium]|nr:DUF502 domain-containing protein [Chloroflexota bacterium]